MRLRWSPFRRVKTSLRPCWAGQGEILKGLHDDVKVSGRAGQWGATFHGRAWLLTRPWPSLLRLLAPVVRPAAGDLSTPAARSDCVSSCRVFLSSAEDRRTRSPSGHEGFRELRRDRRHPGFHGSRGRTATIGHGCRLFPPLQSASGQWQAGPGPRGRGRNTL